MILLAGGIFTSCLHDDNFGNCPGNDNVKLRIGIDQIGEKQPETRASVKPEDGESNVSKLYMLFFQHSASGSGQFVTSYHVDANGATFALDTDLQLEIGTLRGEALSHADNYSIIAFANLDKYLYPFTDSEAFVASLDGSTSESDVLNRLLGLDGLEQVAGKWRAKPIDKACLPMIGRTSKMAGQDMVNIVLSRLVARFDLQNTIREQYQVMSVAIYDAAAQAYVIQPKELDDADKAQMRYIEGKFYGNTSPGASVTITQSGATAGDVNGGLYAFENFMGAQNANKITDLVIGLKSLTDEGTAFPAGQTRYYRIPVRPEGSGQHIMRNNVYKVSLRGVLNEGAVAEDDAAEGQIDYTINNWNIDDEGLIVTDGQSTMAIPSKYIRFGAKGATMRYEIFAVGPGTLSITKTDLPNSFSVELDGKNLTVTAEDLAGYDDITGTFELGYGGLRATLTVIQTTDNNKYLNLNRTTLPLFSPAAGAGIEAGGVEAIGGELIKVSASGDWEAKIFNPYFKINGTEITWDSRNAGGKAPLDFITASANPSTSSRYCFVQFKLIGDAKHSRVLVLGQGGAKNINILPILSDLGGKMEFDMAGAPTNTNPSVPMQGKAYILTVDAGNNWSWEIENNLDPLTGNQPKFDVMPDMADPNKLYIFAKGTATGGLNIGGARNATLKLTRPGATEVLIPLYQQPFQFEVVEITPSSVSAKFVNGRIPTKGTHTHVNSKLYNSAKKSTTTYPQYAEADYAVYREYQVTGLPASVKYDATITVYSHPDTEVAADKWKVHKGFLFDASNNEAAALTNRSNTDTFKVGFHKIYYPLVYWAGDAQTGHNVVPSVTVSITLSDYDSVEPKTVTIYQEPLQAKNFVGNVASLGSGHYGNIGNSSQAITLFAQAYANALYSSTDFGPTGTVRGKDVLSRTSVLATLPAGTPVGYIHASGAPGWAGSSYSLIKSVQSRLDNDETFVLLVGADANPLNDFLTNTNYTWFKKSGWERGTTTSSASTTNDPYRATGESENKRVMNYILHGPFGNVANHNMLFPDPSPGDGVPILKSSLGTNSVSVATYVYVNGTNSDGQSAMCVVDPENRVAYMSEGELFMGGINDANANALLGNVENTKFRKNFAAIMMNSVMYGSHFYDLLREDAKEIAPLYIINSSGGIDTVTQIAAIGE